MRSANSTAVEAATETYAERWRQLVCGIFCMVMIANLQYGWTLFVHPIDQKFSSTVLGQTLAEAPPTDRLGAYREARFLIATR